MNRTSAAAVFLAAAILRSAWLLAQGPEPRFAMSPDSHGYARLALNLRERAVFSLDEELPYVPDTNRTPGYPAFLSLFNGPRPAQWTQAALSSAACALVALAAAALGAPTRAAAAAGLLLAVDLISVAFVGQLLTDVLFQFFLALALWLAASGRWAVTGLSLGAAALVRPLGLYLPLPLAAVAAFVSPAGRRGRASAVLLSAGLILPIAWIGRNKARAGTVTFSSIQGLNALVRAGAAHAEATGALPVQAYAELDAAMRAQNGPFASAAEESAAAGRFAAAYLARHPIAYVRVCLKDAFRLLGGHGLDVAAWVLLKDPRYDPMAPDVVTGGFRGTRQLLARHPAFTAALLAYWIFLVCCYALAARGLLRLVRARSWDAAALCGVPLLYFFALTLGMGAYYRLRMPLMPPLLILAAFGL